MRDAQVAKLAGKQFNRISRAQLLSLGLSAPVIHRRVASGQYVIVEEGVLAIAPVLEHDPWGVWSGATLTSPRSVLYRKSAGAAWGFWGLPRVRETIVRPGSGGPRRHGRILVYRSGTLSGDCTTLRGIPITQPSRTLLDLACEVSARALARSVREAVRLGLTSTREIGDTIGAHRGGRGVRRLASTIARYSGLPIERARSGAEIRAMETLRDADFALPRLNIDIAGEEADLSWASLRLIIEIDGGPFHLDRGEDRRKQGRWESLSWTVRRISADDVYERPEVLLALASASNVPRGITGATMRDVR